MYPYEIKPLNDSINKKLIDDFKGQMNGFVQVGPKKWILPSKFSEHAESYYNMKLRDDDIWILSYPRTGTTLIQELTWMVNNGVDFEKGKQPLIERNLFLDIHLNFCEPFVDKLKELNKSDDDKLKEIETAITPGYVLADNFASPRQIKCHIPISLLPLQLIDKCKVIYIARNPKDVAVSHYHHNKLFTFHGFDKDFEQYWDYFENDLVRFGPFWEHVLEAWNLRNNPNMLFLFYEDVINDLPGSIQKVASFLNKPISPEQMERLVDHLNFDNFKNNIKINRDVTTDGMTNPEAQECIRRGKIGGNPEFTDELHLKADKWIEKHLKNTDLRFPTNK